MNPKDLYVIHVGPGQSYVVDPKAMKAHDLSKARSAHFRDPRKDYGPSLMRQMILQQQVLHSGGMQDTFFYGTADPLKGTPWGAAADRFEEAVAAAGTELEWR